VSEKQETGWQTAAPPSMLPHLPARAPCWQSPSLAHASRQTGTGLNPPLQNDSPQRPPSTVNAWASAQAVPVGQAVD
jgi:hypothetical protein